MGVNKAFIIVACIALGDAARLRTEPASTAKNTSTPKVDADVTQKFADLDKQRKNSTLYKPAVPAHIKASSQAEVLDLGAIPMVKKGGCGHKMRAKEAGLKSHALASFLATTSRVSKRKALEHPGRESFAIPGAGAAQTLAEGASTGTVNGEEPFVTVLKDGFFEVGCYYDSMNINADKYGNGKFKYKDLANVSIARYSELVLDEDKKAMTPTICFEFCRSLPDMVFFGISNGRDCYCEPYFKPAALDSSKCDLGCEGESTSMCGNQEKSTIWEMHLCADTAQDLEEAMSASKDALDFFLEMSAIAFDLGKKMTDGGNALKKAGGLSGAPSASDNGMAAAMGSKPLTQGYQPGLKQYQALLKAHKDGDSLKGEDFTNAIQTTMAEHATKAMKDLTGPVLGQAESIMGAVKLAYPAIASLLGDEPDPADGAAVALAKGGDDFDFRHAAYAMDTTFPPSMSSCSGTIIDSPVVAASADDCGTICSATVYPEKCLGFSYYAVEGDDGLQNLCFLLSEIKEIQTFECEGDCVPAEAGKLPKDVCAPSAICMIKMSEITTGYKPKAEWKKAKRCFGEPASKSFEAYGMPDIGGKVKLLGSTELEAAP